jgi:hypothetical protein
MRSHNDADATAHSFALQTVGRARALASDASFDKEFENATLRDVQLLLKGVPFQKLLETELWQHAELAAVLEMWKERIDELLDRGNHWAVWTNWYGGLILGQRTTEFQDAAFTDIPGELDWHNTRVANTEIERRLNFLIPDPSPIDGIASPIAITRLTDGRIGVEAGPFSLPTVSTPSTPDDHRRLLEACQSRATQLISVASSPHFQGRSEYAQMLRDYVQWLPDERGAGNILLADGEARALNKLFTAEEAILPVAFAGKLSVLLEDQIGLRSFYPEVERHYHAVNTGRLIKPLSRDVVEAIQNIVRSQTPTVFDETVSPALVEAAKPLPNIDQTVLGEIPPADENRPKPPRDPIVDADPRKTQNYTVASAFNRIWSILQKGKGTAENIEGWQTTYYLLKPHIGHVIEFLKNFWPGDGTGGPPLPPTISV